MLPIYSKNATDLPVFNFKTCFVSLPSDNEVILYLPVCLSTSRFYY